MDQWLLRTAGNQLAGPFTKAHIVEMIRQGKLGLQDEVCQGNHYWIFLHEHQEVKQQLGILMPRQALADDDEETTDIQLMPTPRGKGSDLEADGLPGMPDVPEDYKGGTGILSRGSIRGARSQEPHRAAQQSASGAEASSTLHAALGVSGIFAPPLNSPSYANVSRPPVAHVVGIHQLERPAVWRGFVWLLVLAACLVVFLVLRVLRTSH